jgi:hypothetical protein
MVGPEGGWEDIMFEHPALSQRRSWSFNSGDTCIVECLVNRCWVMVNGISVPTTGITLKAGDLIERVAGVTLVVDVETTGV